jgi:L-ribulose-5-phosphate 3-epimerase UlaE
MAATQTDVNNYLGYIRQELSIYGNRLATYHQQGNKPDFPKEIKFMLLEAYVDIAELYLAQWDSSTDDNLMTVAEFEEVMQHINTICNSFHWLDLE